MAKTPRTWTGARSPSGLKRVRSSARRHEILQPRRSAAKTLVKAALTTAASSNGDGTETSTAIAEAMSALDRAAKVGAIHPNAAARRKSRLVRAANAMAGGTHAHATAGATPKTVSRAQAQKAAKARIAAGKAAKAKGAQTAAGKARSALTRTSRADAGDGRGSATPAAGSAASAAAKPAKAASKGTVAKAPAKGTSAKAAAPKASASKAGTSKATAKPAAKAAPKKASKS